jgi:hypothetical protein
VTLDPGYTKADQRRSRCESLSGGEIDLSTIQRMVDQTTLPARSMQTSELNPVMIQVMHMGGMLNQGFLPGIESREPVQEQTQTTFGKTASMEIVVPLPRNR